MRLNYIPRRNIFEAVNYGYLYNWYAAAQPQSVEYGYLYNWYAATDVREIANVGWGVPTAFAWNDLRSYLGTQGYSGLEGKVLKEAGDTYWYPTPVESTNLYEFNWRGAGIRNTSGLFQNIGINGRFWSSSEYNTTDAYIIQASSTTDTAPISFYAKIGGNSIRLIKDTTTLSHGETGTYVGNDGRVYRTICIGTQEWLSENLMETKYQNGDAIPEVTDNTTWAGLTTGARCSYNNLESNAVVDTEIANVGWSVPDYLEVSTLREYIDPLGSPTDNVAGGKVKEAGVTYWSSPNTDATNEYLLAIRGSGRRTSLGVFESLKDSFTGWISTEYPYDTTRAAVYGAAYNTDDLRHYVPFDNWYHYEKKTGMATRLLKDSTTLTHGQTGIYEGNDGKKYPTICIGTQEWLAANLKETKYRDGSLIPVATENTAWAALTTGARCSYNNNEANA